MKALARFQIILSYKKNYKIDLLLISMISARQKSLITDSNCCYRLVAWVY